MQTDPIADFLTRIRNGLRADHDEVAMPASTFKAELARILAEQGYIDGYEVEPARVGRTLRVKLKYTDNRKPVILGIERLSKPGRRQYVAAGEVPKVQGGMGTTIVSTSRGVMTGHDARRAGRRRRARSEGLVAMSPHRKAADRRARRGGDHDRARAREGQGPQGRARGARVARHRRGAGGRRGRRHAARPTAASTARCTGSPAA